MKEITLEAKIENIDAAQTFLHECIDELNCPLSVVMQLEIAVEELFANIAHYAYGDKTGNAVLSTETSNDPKTVTITLTDSGIPYNPLEKEDPDTTLPIEDRPIGGLGIFMVKETMDDMRYEYKDGKNILTIVKNLK